MCDDVSLFCSGKMRNLQVSTSSHYCTVPLCVYIHTTYTARLNIQIHTGPGPGIPSRQVFELCCCEIIDLLFSKEQQWMDAGLAIFHTYLCLMVPSVFILYKFYKIEKNYVRVSGKVY